MYMKDLVVNIKTDARTKKKAQDLARAMGFGLSTLLNAYLKQFIKDKTVHFTAERRALPVIPERVLTLPEIKKRILPVLRAHKIKRASIFGSYVTGEARPDSDVDVLVELPKGLSLYDVIGIKQELEENLRKNVDLVEYEHIREELRDRILSEQIQIL